MKYLFITQVWPHTDGEENMYTDLAGAMLERGDDVTVLLINEKRHNEPTGIIMSAGLRILKVKCGNIQKTNKYTKVISSVFAGPRLVRACYRYLRGEQFDCILWALSTMLIEASVTRLKRKLGAEIYLLLKEYWPQDPADLGALSRDGLLYKFFSAVENRMLRGADYIGTCSEAGKAYVRERINIDDNRIEVCPNCERSREITVNSDAIKKKYGVPEKSVLFVFGGNLGLSQGVDDMIALIENAAGEENAFFLILGSGTEFERVQRRLDGKNSRVRVVPAISQSEFFKLCCGSDVGMLFLNRNYTVPNIPGKFTTYLNAGLPVLGAIDKATDVGVIIERAGCGLSCFNGDAESFARLVSNFCNNSDNRKKMSACSKALFTEQYSARICAETVADHFK